MRHEATGDSVEERLSQALAPSYQLVSKIGEGGMGSVFLARDPILKRMIAIKVLAPALAQDPESRTRFEREAQAVAAVAHPNIVSIFSVGELDDGTPYFLMQYVSGKSLEQRIQDEGPLQIDEAKHIIGQIGSALTAAHKAGIVHRDIKPANVLLDDDSGRILVSDFGISAVTPKNASGDLTKLTQAGMSIGTPAYMSPEQIAAEEVTDRTDIYSLGVVAYELLTGDGPYGISTPQEAIAAHLRDTPKVLSELREDVEPEFEQLITSCLSKDPDQRPAASEIAQRLAPGGSTLLEWPPPGIGELLGAIPRLSRLIGSGTVLFLVAALVPLIAGPLMSSVFTSFLTLAITLSGVAGVILLVAAARASLTIAKSFRRGLRNGHGFLMILEVMADKRGDTGPLIAGMREYARLDAEKRSALRQGRVLRSAAMLLATISPFPLLVAGVWLAAAGATDPFSITVACVGSSSLLVLLALNWGRKEFKEVREVRKATKRSEGHTDQKPLVERWYDSFETVRTGQAFGRGFWNRPTFAWWGGFSVVFATLAAMVVLIPLSVASTIGSVYFEKENPRLYFRTDLRQRIRGAEAYRWLELTPDSTITAIEAGEAAYFLAGASTPDDGFPSLPVPDRLSPFGGEWFTSYVGRALRGAHQFQVIDSAVVGFSIAETEWLRHLVEQPAWEAYATIARAPTMDMASARFVLPFPASVSGSRSPPFMRIYTIYEMASAGAARSAYLLSTDQYEEAERVLLETVSVGFHLMDYGTNLFDGLGGAGIVNTGVRHLQDLYEATGRGSEARFLQAKQDSVEAFNELIGTRVTPDRTGGAFRREIVRLVSDPTQSPTIRWEYLRYLTITPCTNVREMVFGPGPDIMNAIEAARRDLIESPGHEALFDLMLRPLEPGNGSNLLPGFLPQLAYGASRVAGFFLMNERLPGCVRLAL